MKQKYIWTLALFFLNLTMAQAEIYKWVDDNGQVHYSEKAPDNKQQSATEIRIRPHTPQTPLISPEQRRQQRDNLLRAFDEERQLRKDAEAKKQQDEARRRKNCLRARDKFKNYERASALYDLDEQGERVYLSDAQRRRAVDNIKKQIEKWCN